MKVLVKVFWALAAAATLQGCATPVYTYRSYPLTSSPEKAEAQVREICVPRSRLAGMQAKNAALQQSNASAPAPTYNCNTTAQYNSYNSKCTPQGQGLGDAVAGLGASYAAESAYNEAADAALRGCFAEHGWGLRQVCIENCN